MWQPADELDLVALVPVDEHVAEAAHEAERRIVAVRHEGTEPEDALFARERGQSATRRVPRPRPCHSSTTSKAISASGADIPHEPRDPDGPAGLLVDGEYGLAPAAAHVHELRDVALEQTRLGAEEAQPARSLGRFVKTSRTGFRAPR